MSGSLILFLHAHLPYVKHPEYEYSLEENWLFEAIIETYVPILDILYRMADDGLRPNLTLSVSPSLTEMFNDMQLRERFLRHLSNLTDLAEAEIDRTKGTLFEAQALFYTGRLKRIRHLYENCYMRDLTAAFKRLQDGGHIELATTSATHAFLPAFAHQPETVKKQIAVGIESYKFNFGRAPSGFWLPECGYYKGLDKLLKEFGIKYFFLEANGIIHGRPRPGFGIHRPITTPSGIHVFGRDSGPARQVWCASTGYPGDPYYRDFYRDIGFDLPPDYVEGFSKFKGIRTFTGLKYYRITGKTAEKLPYVRTAAVKRAAVHAGHFLESRAQDFSRMAESCPDPLIFAAFDAELFGHWWFEGPEWLDMALRGASEFGAFNIVTPGEYLAKIAAPFDVVEPSPSTWGEGGHSGTWINERNHHIYRMLHNTAEKMESIAEVYGKKTGRDSLINRAVKQAQRETLLSQASDWPFLMEKERAPEYASIRLKTHIARFESLFIMLREGRINETELAELECSDGIFHRLDLT